MSWNRNTAAWRGATKACEGCGQSFELTKRHHVRVRFCSRRCAAVANLPKKLAKFQKLCRLCGKSYLARSGPSKWCSLACLEEARVLAKGSLVSYVERLAYRRGREGLDVDELLAMLDRQGGLCALSGLPMTWVRGRGKVPTNISLDRIKPGEPYTMGNVQLVCVTMNEMRRDQPIEAFMTWCRAVSEKSVANPAGVSAHREFEYASILVLPPPVEIAAIARAAEARRTLLVERAKSAQGWGKR